VRGSLPGFPHFTQATLETTEAAEREEHSRTQNYAWVFTTITLEYPLDRTALKEGRYFVALSGKSIYSLGGVLSRTFLDFSKNENRAPDLVARMIESRLNEHSLKPLTQICSPGLD